MGVIEKDLAEEDTGKDIENDLIEGGQACVEAVSWFAATQGEQRDMDQCREKLISKYHIQTVLQFRQHRLLGLRL